jgi:hypothetical protein
VIAALFVDPPPHGVYAGLPDVDLWPSERDARRYDGPWPVVAHPPCASWCRLAGLREHRYGLKRGEDDGCFESALASVRRWGGVLEHPAWSDAFPTFGLPSPTRAWQRTTCGGWVCSVDQASYGHRAKKATWLYAVGVDPPSMDWRRRSMSVGLSWCENNKRGRTVERMGKRERSRTPTLFRDLLLGMARTVERRVA